MTNFRFHLLTLTSVFVALAAGVGLGTLALHGPVSQPVREQAQAEAQVNVQLRQQVAALTGDAGRQGDVADQLAPAVLAHRLTGRRVLVVATAAGQPHVADVVRMVSLAGAAVTGQLEVTDHFGESTRSGELLDLAQASLPPSIPGGLPSTTDGVVASAALLSGVLVARNPPVTDGDRRAVIAAYGSQGYLTVHSDVTGPADAVAVVTGPESGSGSAESAARVTAVLTLVTALSRSGPVVVCTDTPTGGVVSSLLASPDLASSVSTVDNVGTRQGQLVTAWALASRIGGQTGHYGMGAGASAMPATP